MKQALFSLLVALCALVAHAETTITESNPMDGVEWAFAEIPLGTTPEALEATKKRSI